MLRITPSASAAAAKAYFRDALSTGDYYLAQEGERVRDQEVVGLWSGKAAERLGLSGEVNREAFERLCDNLHPLEDDRLTPKTKTDRRVGYDLTFSVPKSVSVLAELCGDALLRRSIIDAFRESVVETLLEMEKDVRTRVRVGGADHTRLTGETGGWAVAEFVHHTSRPVDGHPDPHLHLHAFAFNATYDDVEGKWKAFDIGDLKRDAPYHQAACDARLAEKLIELGFNVERRARGSDATLGRTPGGDGWEITGIPESVVRGFSRRTEQIEALARDLGITDADAKAKLGATSRGDKASAFTMNELRERWGDRLSPEEAAAIRAVVAQSQRPSREHEVVNRREDLNRSLAFAFAHAFERSSVLSEKRLLALALENGIGKVTPDAMKRRLDELVADRHILRGIVEEETLVTTPGILREEREMLETVVTGRGQHDPLKQFHVINDPALSQEQRHAVTHALTSPDSVMLIAGRAGVGKTRTMHEVVNAIESTGKEVLVAAPTGMATHEVLRADGFYNATTVAHVLTNKDAKERLRGNVLWVDEAGLLSVPDLAKLIRLVKECDARLLLTGDTRQHRSVARGDAMRLLETHAGLPVMELKEIRRQKHEQYREAAEALSKGDLVKGFKSLDAMGAVREADHHERPGLIAEEYLAAIRSGPASRCLVVAPTHAEGRVVTDAIRERLKSEGVLSNETTIERLVPRNLTEAEQGDPLRYRVGDTVQFHGNAIAQGRAGRDVEHFRGGDRCEVVGVSKSTVSVLRSRDGEVIRLPLESAKAFEVFEKSQLNVAVGDRVRITRTGYVARQDRAPGATPVHRLNNGSIYSVESIDPRSGHLVLDNGWRVPKSYGHLSHGYAVTSDSAQGRTVDRLLIVQTEASAGASSWQQFYTSVTRGSSKITVITDDKERLLQSIARDASRMSGTEFMRLAMKPPSLQREKHRSLGKAGLEVNKIAHNKATGLWVAKETTRRMKQEVNRHLERERQRQRDQQRTRGQAWQQINRDRRRDGGLGGGMSRER